MGYQNLLIENRGAVRRIVINRPEKLNALNHVTVNELHLAFDQAAAEDSVRVVVLAGAGGKAFVAGADISELNTLSPVQAQAFSRQGQALMLKIEHLGKPVIAAIGGYALGGGMELALSCQTIVMERGARMGLPEVIFGLFPGMGAYSFLRQRVSPQVAERIILSGNMYEADDLHRMGVVDIVVPRGEGLQAVRELVKHEQRTPHAHLAIGQIRRETTHITHEELSRIVTLWVDTALQLPERSLKIMERLVRAQYRLVSDDAQTGQR